MTLAWRPLRVERASALGLLGGRYVRSTTLQGEAFTLVAGPTRHAWRLMLITIDHAYVRDLFDEAGVERIAVAVVHRLLAGATLASAAVGEGFEKVNGDGKV